MATPKRRRESPADEEGFHLVQRRRPKQREDHHTTAPRSPIPQWRIESHREANAFRVVKWLQEEFKIELRVEVSRTGDFLLRGANWAASTTLEEIAEGQPRGIVLKRRETVRKGVLEGYPTALTLDPVLEHPAVAEAARCTYNAGHGRRLPTRQVVVTLRGSVPASLDLGCWGRFACRPYVAEPLRCFKCQAFGHFQRQCRREKELCGVCSGDHATRDCIRRLRDGGQRPAPCCPNCGDGHHAWNRRCPARLRRIPGRPPAPQEATRPPPCQPTPAPVQPPLPSDQPATRKRRRRNRKRRKTGPQLDSPPSPPVKETAIEVETSRPPEKRMVEPVVLPASEEQPPAKVAPRRKQATQTTPPRIYTFLEADLVSFLVKFEHLVEQDQAARMERCPHEPVLSVARRTLREGRPLPSTLPVSRPLKTSLSYYDHVGEPEWMSYAAQEYEDITDEEDDHDTMEEDDTLSRQEIEREAMWNAIADKISQG